MKRCYEFFILQEIIKESDGKTSSSRLFTEIHPEAEEIIDDVLQKHDRNSSEFFGNLDVSFRREGRWPWAIALFNEEFRLAGHVVSIRRNRGDFSFTAYSIKPGGHSGAEQGVPSVSVLLVSKKETLEHAATQSKCFSAAWEQLADQSENQHWVCIADSPSEEWLRQTSQNDDQLFMKIVGS
jgi:hypothetical protein